MKKFIALMLLSPIVFAEENPMLSLDKFLENLGAEGNTASMPDMLYVQYRCLAYYSNLLAILKSDDSERVQGSIKELEKIQIDLIDLGWVSWKLIDFDAGKENPNYDDFLANMEKSVTQMVRNYQIESNNSWNNTGSYFNEYLNNEGTICSEILNMLKKPNDN